MEQWRPSENSGICEAMRPSADLFLMIRRIKRINRTLHSNPSAIVRKSLSPATPGSDRHAEQRLSSGDIRSATLPNGLRIVSNLVPYVHSVTLGIWINAGSREDPEGLEGIAHFIEHAIFKGTRKRDYIDIARCIEEAGGYIDAWTTKEQTCLCVRCLREHLPLAFDLLADMVRDPVFPKEEIEKEREVVLEEIASVNDTPEELIFEEFDLRSFPGHPLGTPILGTEKSIERFSRKKLRAFMHRHYVPSKMLVTAVGNIGHDEVAQLTESHFGSMEEPPATEESMRKQFDISEYKPFSVTTKKRIYQSQLLLGTIIPRDDSRFWSLMVLNAMLGSGMSCLLNLELREKRGLVYQAYSSLSFLDELTTFNIYAGTDKGKAPKTLETITELLNSKALQEPAPDDIRAAKSKMLGSLIMGMEKMTRRMSRIAQDVFYYGRYQSPAEKAALIEAVSEADVAEAAALLSRPEQLSTLIYKASR